MDQKEQIIAACTDSKGNLLFNYEELDRAMMLWIADLSFDRAAIIAARKELLKRLEQPHDQP